MNPPPQAYVIGAVVVWNYRRDKAGLATLSQFGRSHPLLFIAGVSWLVPHVLIGSHVVDRTIRVLDRLHR